MDMFPSAVSYVSTYQTHLSYVKEPIGLSFDHSCIHPERVTKQSFIVEATCRMPFRYVGLYCIAPVAAGSTASSSLPS